MPKLVAPVFVALLLLSCSARQEVNLSLNGAGTASVHIRLNHILVSYLDDLSSTVGGSSAEHPPIFDESAIRTSFERYPDLHLISVKIPDRSSVDLSLRFTDASQVLSVAGGSGAGAGFATFTVNGPTRTLTVRMDRETVAALLGLTPLSGSVAAEVLLPPKSASMTAEQYVSYLTWALSDYAGRQEVQSAIRDASIDVLVRVAGTVVSQTGGTVTGRAVRFTIPVVELVTAKTPKTYSITYR